MFPSAGSLTNDIGCFGGPFASVLPVVENQGVFSFQDKIIVKKRNGSDSLIGKLELINNGSDSIFIDSFWTTSGTEVSFDEGFRLAFMDLDSVSISLSPDYRSSNDTLIILTENCHEQIVRISIQNESITKTRETGSKTGFIYPNPGKGIFYLDSKTRSEIFIFNSLGKFCKSLQLTQGRNKLDLLDLAQGVYFIKNKDYPSGPIPFIVY